MRVRTALVCGAGGFIGGHLVRRLKSEGFFVRGVDLKFPEFSESEADDFVVGDLRHSYFCRQIIDRRFDEVYQLAADMGGAGFIFTGENDADVMHNSATINLNVLDACHKRHQPGVLFVLGVHVSSLQSGGSGLAELRGRLGLSGGSRQRVRLGKAVQRAPLFRLSTLSRPGAAGRALSQHLWPRGHLDRGREKAPAALCRKIAAAEDGDAIEIWGDGSQTRSFLYISECIEGTVRLMRLGFFGSVNIGSKEMVTIDRLADLIMGIARKREAVCTGSDRSPGAELG
jgi:nucleoside-diphosphate-sugar epimerase